MTPYAGFSYFALLLYFVILTIVLGLFGKANRLWILIASIAGLLLHLGVDTVSPYADLQIAEIWIALGFFIYQGALAVSFLRFRSRSFFYAAIPLAILPLALAKFFPAISPEHTFGYAGISYVTFRALDVVFSIHDGVIKKLSLPQYFSFLFFFPTISSGPVDRYRRFGQDWERKRNRTEFLIDLDAAVERIFRGFLYKFIISALIEKHWVKPLLLGSDPLHMLGYMYSYSLYLFFDFAGYSAFAIGISFLFGVRTPENFNLPFLARNIRDFWNRWHITLSFWFRDHVYMRFLLAAAKGKWFKGKHTASYLGLLLTFSLMGIWHGSQAHFIIYGLYHAALLGSYDWFARWNKQSKFWPDGPFWRIGNTLLTFHAVCFGLLIFSGRLG